ncbi:hypothetical protein GCM10020369_44000 [Cryptosporangium minutisporangium]|uniref:Uncharacterized protein n=1 Tax=Cryptosporangium minutisporangium TaxID=113569 RepID=A0ABP6T0Y6_9ACTN
MVAAVFTALVGLVAGGVVIAFTVMDSLAILPIGGGLYAAVLWYVMGQSERR